jgi:hypothetical protein
LGIPSVERTLSELLIGTPIMDPRQALGFLLNPVSRKRPHPNGEDIHPAKQCREDTNAAVKESAKQTEAFYILSRPPSVNTSGASRNQWKSPICVGGEQHHIDTPQEAALAGALAYDREARALGKQAVELPPVLPQHGYAEQAAAPVQKSRLNPEALGVQKKRTIIRPRPSSGFYGVCYNAGCKRLRKQWKAVICYDKKSHNLGSFSTRQEAALAYDREARKVKRGKLLNYESIKTAEEAAARAQAEHAIMHPLQPTADPYNGMRFQVHIRYGSKDHYLGSFGTRHEAALASDLIARGYACQLQQQQQHPISATSSISEDALASDLIARGYLYAYQVQQQQQHLISATSSISNISNTQY